MVLEPMSGSSTNMNPSAVGMSKVFMLDKYFSELQKFWDTEKRMQGMKKVNKSDILVIFMVVLCYFVFLIG